MNQLHIDEQTQQQITDLCRHIAKPAEVIAISLFNSNTTESLNKKTILEIMLVIRDFKPRLTSYFKMVNQRPIIFLAVDQWIFERDVERGFLGEAFAGSLVFPYTALQGKNYLGEKEVKLKKRLVLELLENIVLSYPELSYSVKIKPQYFMYEIILNRVRIFPPLTYSFSNLHRTLTAKDSESVLHGYMEALRQLKAEKKICDLNGYVTIPREFIAKSQNRRVRFVNLAKNTPRTVFTSFVKIFPQLLTFFSQNSESLPTLQNFLKKGSQSSRQFMDPEKYVFVPTSKGLVSLADRTGIEDFAEKVLFKGEKTKVKLEPVGGVLNDVYLIRAYSKGKETKVLVKRFRDWSGFKWFPLSIWSLGARTFAVVGKSRLAKECAISEVLRCEGFNVPKILHVNNNERLVFMEFVEGEDLSNSIKRLATSDAEENKDKELVNIERVGEIYARVHSLNVTLGDTKPENIIVAQNGDLYLLDFEQASRGGDKSWDIAEFLYYSGHYLQPPYGNGKATLIANSFIRGYLKSGGDLNTVRGAGAAKYTRVFSIFTTPSVILAMSNVCKTVREQK